MEHDWNKIWSLYMIPGSKEPSLWYKSNMASFSYLDFSRLLYVVGDIIQSLKTLLNLFYS